jgi:hypothetical protein
VTQAPAGKYANADNLVRVATAQEVWVGHGWQHRLVFYFMKAQKFTPLLVVVAAGLLAYNHHLIASYPKHVVTSRGDHHDLTPQSVTRFP